jgi:hypothetical protein
VRIERIGLENHRHAAAGGHDIIHHLIADQHFTSLTSSRPAIMRSSVDFPQPEGPTKPQTRHLQYQD